MSEYVTSGDEIYGSRTYLDPNSTYMENGKYYEAIYDVGGIQPIYDPNWREEALFKAQEAVESTPGCFLNYAYVEPNGQVRVQWLYDYDAYAAVSRSRGAEVPLAIPVLAYVVVIAIAAAIAAIFLYLVMSQFSMLSPETSDTVKWVSVAVVAIAGAIIIYLIIRSLKRLKE